MAQFLIVGGGLLDGVSALWIFFILLDVCLLWIFKDSGKPRPMRESLHGIAQIPVNFLRTIVPTMYRGMDFAPWLTLLLLILLETFVFRAMIYWGMVHQPLA